MTLKNTLIGVTLCTIAALMPQACTEQTAGTDNAIGVPLPWAYPRVSLYDTAYINTELPMGFQVNANALITDVKHPDSNTNNRLIDITYPAYGLTMHCTFIPVDDSSRDEITSGRLERMALNVGYNYAEQTELTSPNGSTTIILNTMGRTLTPLQFISVGRDWIISGAAKFAADSVSADSVRPLVEAVKTDIIHAARNLQ